MQEWSVILSAAGLAVLVLSTVGGLIWRLSRIEVGLRAEAAKEIAEVRAETARQITEIHTNHAKDIAALQAKVYEVEIWSRDEFVRKGSFEAVIARMEKGFGDLRAEIAARLDKMADRMEHIGQDRH